MSNQLYSFSLNIPDMSLIDSQKDPKAYNDAMHVRAALNAIRSQIDKVSGNLGFNAVTDLNTLISDLTYVSGTALEDIAPGALVTFVDNSGTLGIKNAAADTALYARGFCAETSTITSGNLVQIKLKGPYQYYSSLIPGNMYYLHGTLPRPSATPATNSQKLGIAITSQLINFQPELV